MTHPEALAIWLHLISNMALVPGEDAVTMCSIDPNSEVHCAIIKKETFCETGAIPQANLE